MSDATRLMQASPHEAETTNDMRPTLGSRDSGFVDRLVGVADVMDVLGVSEASAYRIIRKLNAELVMEGRLTFDGRVSRNYLTMRYLVMPKA